MQCNIVNHGPFTPFVFRPNIVEMIYQSYPETSSPLYSDLDCQRGLQYQMGNVPQAFRREARQWPTSRRSDLNKMRESLCLQERHRPCMDVPTIAKYYIYPRECLLQSLARKWCYGERFVLES